MIDKLPYVVKTIPSNNERGVEKNLKEIVIEFSKPMDKGYAFISVYNEIDFRNGYWKDDKIFAVPLKNNLKSKREYIFFLNSLDKLCFKDTNGNPLIPCLLRFTTK